VPLREKQDSVELIRPLAELGKHFLVQATKNEDDRRELIRRSVLFYERAIRIIESNYSASDVETFIRLMWQIAPDMLELGSFNSFEVLPSLTKFGKLAADLGAENEQYRYGLYVRSLEFYDQAIKTLESWRRSYEDPKLSELWQAVLPILNEVLQIEDEAGLSQSDSIAFQIYTRESTLAAAEVFYGPDSDKLLGLLTRLGSHFANPDALTPYWAVALLHRRFRPGGSRYTPYALDVSALSPHIKISINDHYPALFLRSIEYGYSDHRSFITTW
jgi:hypothetical protein